MLVQGERDRVGLDGALTVPRSLTKVSLPGLVGQHGQFPVLMHVSSHLVSFRWAAAIPEASRTCSPAGQPSAREEQQPAIRNDTGDLAPTSMRLAGRGARAAVTRRRPDATWLWIIDQPAVMG